MSLHRRPFCARKFTQIPVFVLTLGSLFLCLTASSAGAHDFWIEPLSFRAPAGTRVPLRLYVGQEFKGDTAPYIPEVIERYVAVTAAGAKPITAVTGDDPAGAVTVDTPGLTVIGYYSKRFSVTFDSAAEFEQYLIKEGLERHLAIAGRRKSAQAGIVEHYWRCAKALVASPASAPLPPDRAFGFPLELVAETSPYRLGSKKELRVRLLYQDQPLEGALIVAFNKNDPKTKIKVRTDKDGRAVLNLIRPGMWLVTSVHMLPAAFYSRADWESYWASLTFELPAAER
jgi:uncharacterized GH25 family protein